MIYKSKILTEDEKLTFELLYNSPSENYLYSRKLGLVMNKSTKILMDKYFEDIISESIVAKIPLERCTKNLLSNIKSENINYNCLNKYFIEIPNGDFEKSVLIRSKKSIPLSKLINNLSKVNNTYPTVNIGGYPIPIHRIICFLFNPNPENKPFVNHKEINGSKDYYSINYLNPINLEFVTPKENRNRDIKSTESNKYVERISDGLRLHFSEWVEELGISKTKMKKLINKGDKYRRINTTVESYIEYIKIEVNTKEYNELYNSWKDLPGTAYKINRLGILMLKKASQGLTIGIFNRGRYAIRINRKTYQLSTVVMFAFNQKKYSDLKEYNEYLRSNKLSIDHINSNPRDNRAENLREVSTKENNSNPNTLKKRMTSGKTWLYVFNRRFDLLDSQTTVKAVSKKYSIPEGTIAANSSEFRLTRNNLIIIREKDLSNLFNIYYKFLSVIYYKVDSDTDEILEDCSGYNNFKDIGRDRAKRMIYTQKPEDGVKYLRAIDYWNCDRLRDKMENKNKLRIDFLSQIESKQKSPILLKSKSSYIHVTDYSFNLLVSSDNHSKIKEQLGINKKYKLTNSFHQNGLIFKNYLIFTENILIEFLNKNSPSHIYYKMDSKMNIVKTGISKNQIFEGRRSYFKYLDTNTTSPDGFQYYSAYYYWRKNLNKLKQKLSSINWDNVISKINEDLENNK